MTTRKGRESKYDCRGRALPHCLALGSNALHRLCVPPPLRMAIVGLVVLLASVPARRAEAQWHLDIQAGAFSPLNDVSFQEGRANVDIDLDTGGAFAVAGGYALDRWVDFQAQMQTATHFDTYDENVNVFSFTVGGRFFPLPMTSRVRPWLGGQIGWYRVDAHLDDFYYFDSYYYDDDDIDEHDDSFGLNAGGGLDIQINPRVSLGLDVRYHNAFDAFQGVEFVTTMFNVSIWFGNEPAAVTSSDTPPVPKSW